MCLEPVSCALSKVGSVRLTFAFSFNDHPSIPPGAGGVPALSISGELEPSEGAASLYPDSAFFLAPGDGSGGWAGVASRFRVPAGECVIYSDAAS